MKFNDLINLFKKYEQKYNKEVYKYISKLLSEAKEIHRKDWEKQPTPNGDHEQSWRAWKGKNLEKLIVYIIKNEVEKNGVKSCRR